MNGNSSERYFESESFSVTIENLKAHAAKENIDLSDAAIRSYLKVGAVVFQSYLVNDTAPPEIFESLRRKYGRFMSYKYTNIIVEGELSVPSDDEEIG